jgi:hypothetical protein
MIIKGVLGEELNNSLRMKKLYEKKLKMLGTGSLYAKKIKGKTYYYLVKRIKGKVHLLYKGKLSQKKIDEYKNMRLQKTQYRKLLAKAKKQISFLERSLRGKEEV